MKKYFFVSIIFLFEIIKLSSYEFFEQFELKRLSANFYGSCFNQNTLLVYGDGGVILRSTDWGKNWQQISLNDSLRIMDMVYFNNKFFGISRFQYMLVSTDDGLTWELKDFGKDTRFYKLFVIDNNLIGVTRGKVLIFKDDLVLSKEIEIPKKEKFYRDEYLERVVLVDYNLLFQYSSDEMCLLSVKEANYQIFKVTLPQNAIVREVIRHSNGVFLYLDNKSFYELNLENKNLTYVSSLPSAFSRVFTTFGNEVFMLCNHYDKRFNIDSLTFGKFQVNSNFEIINSNVDRHICELSFTNLKCKNKDTMVVVGLYKLIMISFDGGKNWTLNSLFNFSRKFYPTLPYYFIKGKYIRTLGHYLHFFSSNDTGTIWLPPKPMKIDFINNDDFLSYSFSLGTYISEDNGFYIADVLNITEPNIAYTTDGGNSFSFDTNYSYALGSPIIVKYKDDYLLKTTGKLQIKGVWKIKNSFIKLSITQGKFLLERFSIDTTVQFIFITNINDTLYAIVEKNLARNFSFLDTLFVYASYDGAKTWDSLYPIIVKRRTTQPFSIGGFRKFADTLFFNVGFRKDVYDSNNNFLESIYYLNFRERVFKELVAFDSSLIVMSIISKLGKYYLLYGAYFKKNKLEEKILLAKNLESVEEWRELSLNPRYVQGYPTVFYPFANKIIGTSLSTPVLEMEENTLIIQTFDNYHKTPVVFLAKLKPNSIMWADSIKADSLEIPNSEIYVTQPYPNPTDEYFNFKVYFNSNYHFEQINFFVTDVMGRIVAGNNAFVKIPLTNHSIEVKGRLENLSQGSYFVVASLQGRKKIVPVMLVK